MPDGLSSYRRPTVGDRPTPGGLKQVAAMARARLPTTKEVAGRGTPSTQNKNVVPKEAIMRRFAKRSPKQAQRRYGR